MARYSIGLDFGTESVRALVVDISDGRVAGRAVEAFAHGVIDRELPGSGIALPPDYALQHPGDWLESAGRACKSAMKQAKAEAKSVAGVGVDFTSCTMLPALADGAPLGLLGRVWKISLCWAKVVEHTRGKAG